VTCKVPSQVGGSNRGLTILMLCDCAQVFVRVRPTNEAETADGKDSQHTAADACETCLLRQLAWSGASSCSTGA
jgi:hypothetical protein